MIQAKGLRIGNLVKRPDIGNGSLRILELKKDKALVSGPISVLIPYSDLYEIELTEEILLKCGFEESQRGYYTIDDFVISVEGQVYFGDYETWIAEIHHLHQLQNLYFALTGQELNMDSLK